MAERRAPADQRTGLVSFDRLAPHYDWMEALLAGRRLQRARTAWLDALAGRTHILSVGEGHGPFAVACARRFPSARLTCVESSAGMIARARRRAGRAGLTADRINWLQAEVPAWIPPAGAFDAIVTHFFLDCFPPAELAVVIAALARAAKPEAVWLVADFAVPARGPARWRAQAVHALMYRFFRLATRLPARRLTPPDDVLRTHGFTLVGRRSFEWGLLQSDHWARHGLA